MDTLNFPLVFLILTALFGFLLLIGIAIHWVVVRRCEYSRGPAPSPGPIFLYPKADIQTEFDAWYMREYEVLPRRAEQGYKSQYVASMFRAFKAGKGAE